jgi:hypothetical protein
MGKEKGVTKDHKGITTRMYILVMATVFGGRNPMNRTMRLKKLPSRLDYNPRVPPKHMHSTQLLQYSII